MTSGEREETSPVEEILEIRSLTKEYGDQVALQNVSFELKKGEIFGLLGPNGAGKTSLLRIMMGIILPDSGGIQYLQRPLEPSDSRQFGYLPEERGLYLKEKVGEVLVYLGRLKGLEKKEALSFCEEYLQFMGLADWKDKKVENLSKGMQQKIQLLVAIMGEPSLVILDEPLTGLDPLNIRLVKDMIRHLCQDRGCTLVLSTHQMNLVEELCHRVLLLNEGKVVLYDHLDTIKEEYSEPAFLIDGDIDFSSWPEVKEVAKAGERKKVLLAEDVDGQEFLKKALSQGRINSFEVYRAPLENIFLRVVSPEKGERDE